MPYGANKAAYCQDVDSGDEFEDTSFKKKSTSGTKTYPSYMHTDLIPHLKRLSKEKQNDRKVFHEWGLIWVEDIGHAEESCPCGKEGIRYLYHIRNKITSSETFVGSRCITFFYKHLPAVAKIARNLLCEGTNARLIANNADGTAKFKLSQNLSIVNKQHKLKYFKSIPVQIEGTYEKPVYMLTADLTNSKVNMKVGQNYKILVQLVINKTSEMKASVVTSDLIPQKTQIPKDVQQMYY